jgi:hypothetical protein
MGARAGATAVAAVGALALTASAQAGTAQVHEPQCERVSYARYYCSLTVDYRAALGETNNVTVSPARIDNLQAVRFTDTGATMTPGRDCRAGGDHEVVCLLPYADDQTVEVAAGDGDDRVMSDDPSAVLKFVLRLDGGAGNDTLAGGPGYETIVGGAGSDVVDAGGADDEIHDGGPPGEADSYAGGEGRDRLSFHGRREGVWADLPGAADSDALADIEGLTGGSGDDVLVGDARGNSLGGGGGDDRIDAGGGVDVVNGGGGDDVLIGGAGRDRMQGARGRDEIDGGADADTINPDNGSLPDDRAADSLACGIGADMTEEVTIEDFVAPGCERVGLHDLLQDLEPNLPLPSLSSAVARLRGSECPNPRVCRTTLLIRAAPGERRVRPYTLLGQTVGRGVQKRTVRLSPLGRTLLARHRVLRVRVIMEQRSPALTDRGGFTTELRLR